MCGIFGFIGPEYSNYENDLSKMRNSLKHRGPDSDDVCSIRLDAGISVNLGHSRLAIIDTTFAGKQPMRSKSGRYTIVFNGEIYNFKQLKSELNASFTDINWESTSDTEVLLMGLDLFGNLDFIEKLDGMFAIALWDNVLLKFFLIRDRIGEKPLYFGYQGDYLIFASELKALEAHSMFEKKLNLEAAVGFLIRSYIPFNLSIYEKIEKVKPGVILEFSINALINKERPIEKVYWSFSSAVEMGRKNSWQGTYEEAKLEFERLLIEAVKKQSVSDVPIGAFLSGGVDSSLVCAIMQKYVNANLFTFTIGMPSPGIDESVHAKKVASFIGTEHYVQHLKLEEVIADIEEIISKWDEPFADSSQIPTYYVSKLAKEFVTVSLSGDGADEFLFGYPVHKLYGKYGRYKFISTLKLDRLILFTLKFFNLKNTKLYTKFRSLSVLLNLMNKFSNLGLVHSHWQNKFWDTELPVVDTLKEKQHNVLNFVLEEFENVGYYDALTYLPNDILVKVDRAAMAVSLESRAPFLDHHFLEFLFRLPMDYIYKDGVSKRIAKDVLYNYVPESIVNRPKQGFSIPVSYWLRNDLRNWAESIIHAIPNDSEFWDKAHILKLWDEHLFGNAEHPEKMWNIIVLELFFKRKGLLHYSRLNYPTA